MFGGWFGRFYEPQRHNSHDHGHIAVSGDTEEEERGKKRAQTLRRVVQTNLEHSKVINTLGGRTRGAYSSYRRSR